MLRILELALKKYNMSKIVPGEAVGAVGAQSLSEPGTTRFVIHDSFLFWLAAKSSTLLFFIHVQLLEVFYH